jgi:hypothetical protein
VKLNLSGSGMKRVKTRTVHWSQGDVLQATYVLPLDSVMVRGIQDHVWHKGKVFIVTFSSASVSVDESVAKAVGKSWHWS